MTRILHPFQFVLFTMLLIGIAVALNGCSSAIDNIVDDKVAQMLEQENKKLPANVGNGIRLMSMSYDESLNQLTMVYHVSDRRILDSNFPRIKSETNNRVQQNDSLTRAMDNGIEIHHHFFVDEIGEGGAAGQPNKSFVTRK